MPLLDYIRMICRLSDERLDAELYTYIDAARTDMLRVGIESSVVTDENNALVTTAIGAYCKAQLGMDNSEANRFNATYRQIVCDLLNSAANSAARSS